MTTRRFCNVFLGDRAARRSTAESADCCRSTNGHDRDGNLVLATLRAMSGRFNSGVVRVEIRVGGGVWISAKVWRQKDGIILKSQRYELYLEREKKTQ